MTAISHCPRCGQPDAVLAIRGERSSLFECRCGFAFERDRPARERPAAFQTAARYQGQLFDLTEHPS